jgi:hypothetical protein
MASNGDMKAHEGTYTGFLGLLKWGIILCTIVAAVVITLISG